MTPKVRARWTDDCQGKKDYDGEMVSLSTRCWPPRCDENGKYTAHSSVLLRWDGDEAEMISRDFSGDNLTQVQAQVEEWAQKQFEAVAMLVARLRDVQ